MITLLLHLLLLLPVLLAGHRQLVLENIALRQPPAVYKRMMTRPRLRRTDRLFARIWAGWRQSLVIVTPDTVLRWQRRRFREHWTRLSGRTTGGRPPINGEPESRSVERARSPERARRIDEMRKLGEAKQGSRRGSGRSRRHRRRGRP